MEYAFHTANAFTDQTFQGAQIAVVPKATGLSAKQMQKIAAEFNLSETVFVFPEEGATDSRRLRIFSPHREIDFAGHPILAAGTVLGAIGDIALSEGHTKVVFEQNTGPIDVYIRGGSGTPDFVQFGLQVKPIVDRFVPRSEEIASFLGLETAQVEHPLFRPLMVACDRPYLVVPLRDANVVLEAKFDARAWNHSSAPTLLASDVLTFSSLGSLSSSDFRGRLMGPAIGPQEDPPIGSSMPAFAAYLCAHDHIAQGTHSFAIERGTRDTRLSVLHVEMDHRGAAELDLRVGGPAVLVSHGQILAPES